MAALDANPIPFRRVVKRALTSESFVEKLSLLLLTALISGALIPIVLKSVDARSARNEAILQAQSKLLDDISETVLTYETLALDVSWFGTPGFTNKELQEQAFQRYSSTVPQLVARWRTLASRAYGIAPPGLGTQLEDLLLVIFEKQDSPTVELYNADATAAQWQSQHRMNVELLAQCNRTISNFAAMMRLTNADLH